MCGIGGILRFDGGDVEPAALQGISNAVAHRGPDGEGFYTGPASQRFAGLIHRRLAILDLSNAGRQPMTLESSGLWITYNGEIYNFRELRKELEANGHRFQSNSDTEVILRLYRDLGVGCLNRLRGMFAFALWDEQRRELFLARDRLGIKPLVYYLDSKRFVFASEVQGVLADPTVPRTLDQEGLATYLERGYVGAPRTVYAGVRKLPPGHYALVRWDSGPESFSEKRYWRVRFEPREVNLELASERLLEKLREAVTAHLVSDVPVGAFLSGGMDSSAIVALAGPRVLRTFVMTFEGGDRGEAEAARAMANLQGIQHEEHYVSWDILEDLPRILEVLGEPMADPALVPTFKMSRLAREAVKVCLSGDGGDEVFGGYDGYAQALVLDRLKSWGRPLSRLASVLLPPVAERPLVRRLGMRPEERLEDYGRLFQPREVVGLLGVPPYHQDQEDDVPRELLSRYQLRDLKAYLPGNNLPRVDWSSMYHGLEVRVPLLDHVLIEEMAQVPARLKMPDPRHRKVLLRKALTPMLPTAVLDLPKRGFGPPLRQWLTRELADMVGDVLLSGMPRVLASSSVREEVQAFRSSHGRDRSHRVWALLVLELWLRGKEKTLAASAVPSRNGVLCP